MNFHPLLHRRTQRSLYELASEEERDARLLDHAAKCPKCRQDLLEMQEAIGLVDRSAFQRILGRPEMYWQAFGDRVARRLSEGERSTASTDEFTWFGSRPAFLAGAATALTVVVVAVAAWWWTVDPSATPTVGPPIPTMNVRDRAFDYFERSRVVLIGVLNADAEELGHAPDLLRENGEASRRLVEEARDLNRDLVDPGDARLLQLVNELEVILVQLSNLEAEQKIPGLEFIRDGVRRRGVLLKITIEEMNRLPRRPLKQGSTGEDTEPAQRSL